jgi:Protein kinase domain
MSSPTSCSSWAERPHSIRAFEAVRAGDVIAGFRVERLIGRGETGAVFEATQLSLGRAVALRLIDPARYADAESQARLDRDLGLASSLYHPGLVPLFEAGKWDGGRYVAMRLVRGRSLASLLQAGAFAEAPGAEAIRSVSAGLEAAHRAGLTHGAVRPENVLVDADGRAFLADLGLARGSAVEADREGLAALRGAVGAPAPSRTRSAQVAAGVAAVATALVAAALLLGDGFGGSDQYADEPAPPLPDRTVSLGSRLSPGPAERVGCGGRFGGASGCTLVPADIDGTALQPAQPGVIRSWAVRGAAGELTLQVLRSSDAATRLEGFAQPVAVPDPGPHRFSAEIGLDRGDIVAVKLAPGAVLGLRDGSGTALRWAGTGLPLPSLSEATPLNGEPLVRVDVEPGARPSGPAQITGRRARTAPRGRTLAETSVAVSARRAFRVRLVRIADRIRLDVLRGARRTARLAVTGTDPGGELVLFEQSCGHPRSVCMRWRNPGEATPVVHEFRVAPSGRFRVIG